MPISDEQGYARIRFSLKIPLTTKMMFAVEASQDIERIVADLIDKDEDYDGMLFQTDGLDGDG